MRVVGVLFVLTFGLGLASAQTATVQRVQQRRYQVDTIALNSITCIGYNASVKAVFRSQMVSLINSLWTFADGRNLCERVEVIRCRRSVTPNCPVRIRIIAFTIPVGSGIASDVLTALQTTGYKQYVDAVTAALPPNSPFIPSMFKYNVTNPQGQTRQTVCRLPPIRFPPPPKSSVCGGLRWDPATQVVGDVCSGTGGDVCTPDCNDPAQCVNGTCVCPSPQNYCDGACSNPNTDNANCGYCGNACTAPQTCINGVCACPGPNQILCNGACVDQLAPENCGGCSNQCKPVEVCVAPGVCQCPDPANPVLCGNTCTNTTTDSNNCDTCGNVCSGGQYCSGGKCICAPGLDVCNGQCTDYQIDPFNCGACNVTCPDSKVCEAGQCVCPGNTVWCNGACRDLSSDKKNCGSCGKKCYGDKVCINGSCTLNPCPTGQYHCEGDCVDLSSNNRNCGRCGKKCKYSQTCVGGSCQCGSDQKLCKADGYYSDYSYDKSKKSLVKLASSSSKDDDYDNDYKCTDIKSDRKNCGDCGVRCKGDKVCVTGSCVKKTSSY